MEADPSLLSMNVGLGVLLVDILLSGDNAIVIALVCRSLSKEHRAKALWLGVLGALLARLVLTSVASLAMNLPLIKLVGGLLLLKISIDLLVHNTGPGGPLDPQDDTPSDVLAAAKTIVLADLVMSLDNVVALSAISQNNTQMLVAGLLLSVPILMFGSLYIARLLDVLPWLVWAGGAVLGGVSGALIIDDPIFGGAFSSATSLANLFVPVLAAVFVVQISRVMVRNAGTMGAQPKPPALWDILWRGGTPASTAEAEAAPAPTPSAVAPVVVLPSPALPAMPAASQAKVAVAALAPSHHPQPVPAAARPPVAAQPQGDHRVVMALGLFMMLSGGVAYYMLNAYEPAVPDNFQTYFCQAQAVSIRYQPSGQQIRFTTPKGSVTSTVVEDRIVWDDYRAAGARLGVSPAVKIVMADAAKLVVNGGVFDNASCLAAGQR